MGNRLYTAGIVVFWVAAMSWLVAEKILPPFYTGDPPITGTIHQDRPVAWQIHIDNRECGTAVLQAIDSGDGTHEVHSCLEIGRLPRPAAVPLWIAPFVTALDSMSLDMRTRIGFDSLGRLGSFETRIWINRAETPLRITGTTTAGKLCLQIKSGNFSKVIEKAWPADGLLASEVMPESKLLSVYPGKRWQKEVFSPFASLGKSVELLEAEVTGNVKLLFGDEMLLVRVVEYRTLDRTGASTQDSLRAKMWVSEDGRVLKQEAYLFGSRLTFSRQDEATSEKLGDQHLQIEQFASSMPIKSEPPPLLPREM